MYGNPYDPDAPNLKIQTELAAYSLLISLLYKPPPCVFFDHPKSLTIILNCDNVF
jgi:hypothetical protein